MSPVGYGAVNVHDEFDEKNTYYLNETRCNWNRFFRAVVPVVIALVIMGGFAYGMSHGFTHLYGPPKATDEGGNTKQDISWVPIGNDVEDSSTTSDSDATNAAGSSAECSMNSKCASLGLTGMCCPTKKGVLLECCM
ncbi:hypothetical protein ACHAWU_008469 [Discostella pseudostelligera]|uniref:Uncharacterized protein n=1 Tax=Discostella pseudostelligera TaxID=259834 RepID=A0ABD3LZY2_9STRA